jgi:hypothetical protein
VFCLLSIFFNILATYCSVDLIILAELVFLLTIYLLVKIKKKTFRNILEYFIKVLMILQTCPLIAPPFFKSQAKDVHSKTIFYSRRLFGS